VVIESNQPLVFSGNTCFNEIIDLCPVWIVLAKIPYLVVSSLIITLPRLESTNLLANKAGNRYNRLVEKLTKRMEKSVVPVSKKRKKRQKTRPPIPKSKVAPKKKITTRQILIYVISGLMILSLAIGFLAGSGRSSRTVPTSAPQGNNILLATPAPDDQSDEAAEPAESESAPEPTSEN
jgi:hypothetical protein